MSENKKKKNRKTPNLVEGKKIIKIRADILRAGKDRGQEEKQASWTQWT